MSFAQQKIERMRELLDPTASEREAAACFQHYVTSFESHWQPFDDVLPCLQRLDGQRLGIITNGDMEQQQRKLEVIGLSDRFEVLVASSKAGIAKPDARIFEFACERAGTPLHTMVYIGDDVKTDIAPCQALGLKGIWVNRMNEMPVQPVPYAVTTLANLFDHLP
ncbi:HAD family hydrolase [Paenibacillus sp. J5C_2022]|uniref:HAD family hydrolase n=1 Tax=Paenibacillus sp. J5C2022 TaxID=2977129 RepID=UPI0021CE1459|nr:HAD family hydrolase [Paenibacillus sp. J5C2022]MCU6711348.1 HAD family hydrolase [Paenibacillus sp. J5C2022]